MMEEAVLLFMLLTMSQLISKNNVQCCKDMVFKVTIEDRTLKNHVIKTIRATDDAHCEALCFLDDRCLSYSYGTSADGQKNMCELHDTDHFMHPEDLDARENVIYRSAQNTCTCKGSQTTCKYDFINKVGTCVCKLGFTGTDCEINIDDCSSSPCQHGGTCVDETNGYKCLCLLGTYGTHCEHNIDDCANITCQNQGTCVDQINAFKCVCVAGYTGQLCDQEIDECASNPCNNGGTCTDMLNGFSCTCDPSYYGAKCENTDYCVYRPCQNGGTCTDRTTDTGRCTCTSHYQGTYCQYQKYCETHVNPCLGSRASCRNDGQDGYWCHCRGEDYSYSYSKQKCVETD